MTHSYEERIRRSKMAREKREGRPALVPAKPVVKRMEELEQHMSRVELAQRLNIPLDTMHMWRYRYRKNKRAKITRMYAERVLSFELPSDSTTRDERIRGAQRIYRGLAARGWPMQVMCDAIDMDVKGFRNIVCASPNVKRGFSPEAYAKLKVVAAKLETQNPYDVMSVRSVNTTKGKAHTGSAQWVDIGAWDLDEIHLEKSRPDITGHCGTASGVIIHLREGQELCERCAGQSAGERSSAVDPHRLKELIEAGDKTHREIAELLGVSRDLVSKYAMLLDGGRKVHSLTRRNAMTMRGDCDICGPGVQLYRSGARLQCAEPIKTYRETHPTDHGRKPKDEH